MKGSFKFILRDENDLAYKWIKDKRKSPSQNIKGGVSVYALGEYFFNVFFLNKLFGFENANQITKLIKDNNSSKDRISFGEEWTIPFNYEEYLIKKGSVSGFSDIAKELGNQIIYQDKKLTDILSNAEIQALAVNSYHIFYDILDAKDNLSYDEILAHPKLFFKDKSELIFLLPCSIKIPIKQVIESKKESVTNIQTGTQKVEVNKKIIVLDPGHGGVWDSDLSKTGDPGASSRDGKTHEATIVLSIAKKLKTKLEQNNYTVILTRDGEFLPLPSDYTATDQSSKRKRSLKYRAEFAKEKNANMFISLHLNSVEVTDDKDKRKDINGFNVYYYDSTKTNSKKLSEKLLEANTVFTDGEVKIEDFAVIVTWSKDNTNPGCLVELGYITNADDLKKQKEKQDDIAKELCEGIKKYYEN